MTSQIQKFAAADVAKASGQTDRAIDELIFMPAQHEREAKAKFWERWRDDPQCAPDQITAAAVVQELGDPKFHSLWKKPGFSDWFCDSETFLHKTIANGERGLEVIQEILNDSHSSDSLKLKAALASIDAVAKLRDKNRSKSYSDEDIQNASPEELRRMITRFEN